VSSENELPDASDEAHNFALQRTGARVARTGR